MRFHVKARKEQRWLKTASLMAETSKAVLLR